MDEHILTTLFDQPNSSRATPYLRGLAHVVQQQRIDYILARTQPVAKNVAGDCWLLPPVWLVIAMSLFATHSIPMVWRSLHPYTTIPDPDESTFTKARQRPSAWHRCANCSTTSRPSWPRRERPAFSTAPGVLMGIDGTTFRYAQTPPDNASHLRSRRQPTVSQCLSPRARHGPL